MNDKARVLIIDDQEGIRGLLDEICLVMGYQTVTACSGVNALAMAACEIVAGNDIKVAFVDMKMPGLSGLDTLKGIHALNPNIKIYLMTGFAEDSLSGDAIKYGACGIIPKPFSLEKIKEILEMTFS